MDKRNLKFMFESPVVPGQPLYLKTRNHLPCMSAQKVWEQKKKADFQKEQFIQLYIYKAELVIAIKITSEPRIRDHICHLNLSKHLTDQWEANHLL